MWGAVASLTKDPPRCADTTLVSEGGDVSGTPSSSPWVGATVVTQCCQRHREQGQGQDADVGRPNLSPNISPRPLSTSGFSSGQIRPLVEGSGCFPPQHPVGVAWGRPATSLQLSLGSLPLEAAAREGLQSSHSSWPEPPLPEKGGFCQGLRGSGLSSVWDPALPTTL